MSNVNHVMHTSVLLAAIVFLVGIGEELNPGGIVSYCGESMTAALIAGTAMVCLGLFFTDYKQLEAQAADEIDVWDMMEEADRLDKEFRQAVMEARAEG